jgi:hypothetical protein
VAEVYQRLAERIPWGKIWQSPRGPDRLDNDKLTIYCGDDMFIPEGDENEWLDVQTQHVIAGGDHYHYGDETQRLCRPSDTMFHAWTFHPGQDEWEPGRLVIICEGFLDLRSSVTGQVRAATVREAIAQGRIQFGMSMDWIAREVVLSPALLHEMFHVALTRAGSKSFAVDMAHHSLTAIQCYQLMIRRKSTSLKHVQRYHFIGV